MSSIHHTLFRMNVSWMCIQDITHCRLHSLHIMNCDTLQHTAIYCNTSDATHCRLHSLCAMNVSWMCIECVMNVLCTLQCVMNVLDVLYTPHSHTHTHTHAHTHTWMCIEDIEWMCRECVMNASARHPVRSYWMCMQDMDCRAHLSESLFHKSLCICIDLMWHN